MARVRVRGSALIGAMSLTLMGALLVVGGMMFTGSQRRLAHARTDSEAALLLAEAGVNDELNQILRNTANGSLTPTGWGTAPTKLTGQPYAGRKGTITGTPGSYWVYSATAANGTTAWSGTGPVYITCAAVVNGALRKVAVEAEVTCPPAVADAPVAGALHTGFNAFVQSTVMTQGGHSDGPMLVGGSWTGKYEVNQHNQSTTVGSTPGIGLYVVNSITPQDPYRVLNGNAQVGKSVIGTMQMNNGRINYAVDKPWFDSQVATISALSSSIRYLSGKRTISISDPNNINVNVTQSTANGRIRVFTVDASKLSSLSTFNPQNMTSADTLIIDVTGSSTVNWGWQVNSSFKNRIIWNFRDATTINVSQRNFDGMLLAPKATVNQCQNIQGNVYCKSLKTTGSPELHFGSQFKFVGQLPPIEDPCGGTSGGTTNGSTSGGSSTTGGTGGTAGCTAGWIRNYQEL
ncbi:MAG: collagen-binding domain-containing protein [Fimbriimonadaceae bacterium]|nr:collagen-binding domain-containing protein [Fimbriimonadaceae bacterium]